MKLRQGGVRSERTRITIASGKLYTAERGGESRSNPYNRAAMLGNIAGGRSKVTKGLV